MAVSGLAVQSVKDLERCAGSVITALVNRLQKIETPSTMSEIFVLKTRRPGFATKPAECLLKTHGRGHAAVTET